MMMGWLSQFFTRAWVTFFGAVLAASGAVIAAGGVFWSSQRQAALSAQLVAKSEEVAAKSDELAAKNEELAAKSDEIARLTADSLGAVTGGDSFCYLYVVEAERSSKDQGSHTVAVHVGKYPLYDLEIRFVTPTPPDFPALPSDLAARLGPGHSMNSIHRNMRPGTAEWSFSLGPLGPKDVERFTFSFTARNGSWTQNLTLRKVGAEWKAATMVVRDSAAGKTLLREEAEPGFPVNLDGEIRW